MSSNQFIILILAIITASALVVFGIVMLPRILDDMQASRDRGAVCISYRLSLVTSSKALEIAKLYDDSISTSQDEIERARHYLNLAEEESKGENKYLTHLRTTLDEAIEEKERIISEKNNSKKQASKSYRDAMELYEDGKCTRVH